tara:strand:+ start:349 stop:570 length:222 start_codon:yes stop_codon:yes gene_type:complete
LYIDDTIILEINKNEEVICHKCGKPATGRYSPDNTIAGLAFCDKHKELTAAAFYCLLQNDKKTFNQLMETNLQ